MARKKSKLNFLDSLLGGLARGFQLSQQFESDKQKKDLEERKFGIQEQEVGFKERQLALQEQAAKDQQRKNLNTQKFLTPFLQDILQSFAQQPSQAPVPQQPAPPPAAQERAQAISQPAPTVSPIQEASPPILTDTSRPQPPIGEGFNPPTGGETDITLERQQQVVSEFPQFNAELQKIRNQLGLPDFNVSGENVGIPVNIKFSAPDLKRTTRRLKTSFIQDQKKLRGINKFDILAFRKLLKDVGVSTAELQGDLDEAFEEAFRKATSGKSLANLSKQEKEAFEQDILNDLGAEFGSIPEKFEAKSQETNRIIDTKFKAAMFAGGATDEQGNIIDKSKIVGVLESLKTEEKVNNTLLTLANGTKISRSDLRAEYMLENDIKTPLQLMILEALDQKAWVAAKKRADNAISFAEWAKKFRGVDVTGGTKIEPKTEAEQVTGVPLITTQEEFDALPEGAHFTDEEGIEKIK